MIFEPPVALSGSESERLSQVYRYLFVLSEKLNHALAETDNQIDRIRPLSESGSERAASSVDMYEQYNGLRSLIVKSADIVRSEMDVLETTLRSDYLSQSEWGIYREHIDTVITDTAALKQTDINFEAQISSLNSKATDFSEFKIATSGFIKQGIIGYDSENMPVIGIAIGEKLRSKTVTINDKTYEEIDMTQNMAIYTSKKVSFWQNGVEVAYFSNSQLIVTSINVSDRIVINGKWEINRRHGFGIKWIG